MANHSSLCYQSIKFVEEINIKIYLLMSNKVMYYYLWRSNPG